MNTLQDITDKDLALLEDDGFTRDVSCYWSKRISNVPYPPEISSEGFMDMVIHVRIPFDKSSELEVVAWVRSKEKDVRFLYFGRLENAKSVSEILEWCNEQEDKFCNNELVLNGKKIGYKGGLKWKLMKGDWVLESVSHAIITPSFSSHSFGSPVEYNVYVRNKCVQCKTWDEALATVHERYPLVVLED